MTRSTDQPASRAVEPRMFDRWWKQNNERLNYIMISLERNENNVYAKQEAEELEVRVQDARATYGCDGSHAYHSTGCNACYLIRKAGK